MTVHNPEAFMRSLAAGFDGKFDWDFLFPAFAPTKIQPTDIDCMIERNGYFLAFETKEGDKKIPLGQEILLEAGIRAGWMVIILRQKRSELIRSWEVWFGLNEKGKADRRFMDGNSDALWRFVRRHWFLRVDSRQPPYLPPIETETDRRRYAYRKFL